MQSLLNDLKNHLYEAADLQHAAAVLEWDMSTYMPPEGASRRGRALGTLARLHHERMTAPEVGHLLDQLEPLVKDLPYDDDDAALVRLTRREYDQSVKVPADLVAQISALTSSLYDTWTRARPANDFAGVADGLERVIDLLRQTADCFPGYEHIADPLIDRSDYGMTVSQIRAVFGKLRAELTPIAHAIIEQTDGDDSVLRSTFPIPMQEEFGLGVARAFGYDFNRGRQDLTHHPFMTRFGAGDIRITDRYQERYLAEGLMGTMHETGHALYEQGIDQSYDATPLGGGTSAGVHESQSRTWENLVGRSLGFWEHYYPQLQAVFPDQLNAVSLERFYRAINRVRPSLIRTDADEVTYNLHVMIRFDLECALLEGSLAVKDLPDAWQARYASDLGVSAPDNRDGVLQDVHWYSGGFGVFQSYTLGNLIGAQFFAAAHEAMPHLNADIATGQFGSLRGWLTENIYRHGSKFTANDLLERVTGTGLRTEPWIAYIREKYGALFTLPE